jgi:DNA-binding protein Fis
VSASKDGGLLTNWTEFVQTRLSTDSQNLYAEAVVETESKLLDLVLRHTGGNQAHAARLLGMTRASLRKKIKLLRMTIPR